MAVNVKMGVDLSGFRSGIQQGTQILKGLNAEMKASEAEFKATGNAEQKLTAQTKNLNSQIQVQKGIVDQAQKALKQMRDAGVDPTDKAYQQMYATMMKAQTGMYEAQAALNGLGASAQSAAAGADQLSQSVNSIGKKMSLDQVISGIDKITGGLEKAAQKAIQLGQTILDEVVNAAKWADDTATMAQIYDIPLDRFLRMQGLVQNGMDTSVESMLGAMDRLKRGVGNETKDTMDTLAKLGMVTTRTINTGFGLVEETGMKTRDATMLFWEAGQAMMKMGDDFDKEAAATALFGKSWKDLKSLFTNYKDAKEYEAALEQVNVNSEETVTNLATLNDKLGELEGNFNVLKTEIIGQLAPGLEKAADALSGLLTKVIEYLQTEKGQEMLQSLSDSFSKLFDGLAEIDPESVVESFTTVFNGLVGGLQWIWEHQDEVVGALTAIVGGWAALEITGGILDVVKIVQGIQGVTSAGVAEAAGKAAGASWGSGFASAVMAAAPWLIGIYTLLNPAGTAGNNWDVLFDEKTGKVTAAGWEAWSNDPASWNERLAQVGEKYAISELIGNETALNIIGNQTIDIEEIFRQLENQGFEPRLPAELVVPDDTASKIAETVGTVEINGVIHFLDENGNDIGMEVGAAEGPVIHKNRRPKKGDANGLPYVPYDGMLARLHKGERVVPAREAGRSFSSNLYVENMNMNGGLSADALAASIASRNRRVMAGFGS